MQVTPHRGYGSPPAATISPWALDVLLAVSILMLLNAAALRYFQDAVFKARAIESIVSVSGQKVALIEHYALTGNWLDSDVGILGDAASSGTEGASGILRGAAAAKTDSKDKETVKTTSSGISNGVVLTVGIYPGYAGVAMMGMRPAVMQTPEQPVMRWFCGRAPLPAGWSSPVEFAPTNLPGHLLYSFCRESAKT